MKISDETLRKLTKTQLLKNLSGAEEHDISIGTIRLESLPPRFFNLFIRQHNTKVDYFLQHIHQNRHELRSKVESLKIPTYRDFQHHLDDPDRKRSIDPMFRKPRCFATYQKWVLQVPPLSTTFKYLVRKPMEYFLPFHARKKHMFLVGASGSGKSEAIKTFVLGDKAPRKDEKAPVSNRVAILLMEPHGDLSEEIGQQKVFFEDFRLSGKEGREPNLIFIDPFLEKGKFPVLNPFEAKGKSDVEIGKLAQQLCSAIVSMLGDAGELSLTMETLLIPCLVLLLQLEGTTFHDFLKLMNNDPHLVDLGMHSTNTTHRDFFRHRFLSPSFKRTKSGLSTRIQANLNHEAFERMMSQPDSTLDLEAEIQKGKTIIFSLSKGKLGDVATTIGKLICARLLAIALNRSASNAPRMPTILVMDEMQNYVNRSLEVILAETRKYSLFVLGAQQHVGQGMDVSLTRAILGNTAVKGIGKAGNHSIQHMAREMGVSPDFFHGLGVGEFICQSEDNPPVRIQFTDKYVGNKTQMSPEEWEEFKASMLQKYYVADESGSRAENSPFDFQLMEDLEATATHIGTESRAMPLPVRHFEEDV